MMNRKASIAVAITIAIVAVIGGMLLSRALLRHAETSQSAVLATGTLLEPPRALPRFALVDHENRTFDNERLRGHWTFVFFGFTNCPDVCPTTMRMLSQVENSLEDLPQAQRPRVVLVSVDPKRDGPEQLATYMKFFDPAFVGVTGEPNALEDFTRQLGVPVAITSTGEGGYTVDHSAAIFLINTTGEMRALFSPPHSPTSLAADYRRLVGASEQ